VPPRRRAGRSRRSELARYGAPLAFLVAVTIAVLLVRAAIDREPRDASTPPRAVRPPAPPPPPPATQRPSAQPPAPPAPPAPAAEFYEVESGDTFGTISSRFGTTVEELERLNPGVESSALSIGQRIRVK
jgi:LysM repeat protein